MNATSTGGDITQASGSTIAVQGTTTVDAGRNDVSLNGAANNFVGTVNATGHDVTLVDGSGGLTLGNINASGTLSATSTGGDLSQSSGTAIHVGGGATLSAPGSHSTIGDTGNTFGGSVTVIDVGGSHTTAGGTTPAPVVVAPLPTTVAPTLPTPDTAPPALDTSALTQVVAPNGNGAPAPAAANDASLSGASGVKVQLVNAPTDEAPGLLTVEVPRDATATGFSFGLPGALSDQVSASDTIVATKENGRPLPAWLQFDRAHLRFVATAVPARGLPLKVVLKIGNRSTTIQITRESARQARAAAGAKRAAG